MNQVFYLPGGDDNSSTVLVNGEILRIYDDTKLFREAVSILNLIQAESRLDDLIVSTKILKSSEDNLTLLHKTLSFNLPENWSLNQYLNVIEAHSRLLQILNDSQLTLKDHLPENFVIHQGLPVFVDFGSIVKKSGRNQISWINQARGRKGIEQYLISELMFPFMLLPLFVGLINSESEMRNILKYEYCNSGLPSLSWKRVNFKNLLFHFNPIVFIRVSTFFLFSKFYKSEVKTLIRAVKLFKILLKNSDRNSNYLNYYKEKGEQFKIDNSSNWNSKQLSVREVIQKTRPSDVLDLGCNTGWFSVLAAKNKCRVKSLDIDPVLVDHLYLRAQQENLEIEPYVLDLKTLADFKGIELSERDLPKFQSRKLPATSFDSDLVLALGLIHHLVLGLGYSIQQVMKLLSSLANKTLVLEFVSLDDDKIVSEQDFFPAFDQTKFSYTKKKIIEFGLEYFNYVEIFPSNPKTRELLVFRRS